MAPPDADTGESGERILILTPSGRDGEVASRILEGAGIVCHACPDIEELCSEISRGVGAILVAGEALPKSAMCLFAETLEGEPSWSEVPIIMFSTPGPDGGAIPWLGPMEDRHFTIMDRPLRIKTLISATRAALRSRKRQYQVRSLMEQLEARVHERDKFLAILGHELRNPIGAILLASQMVDENEKKLDIEHAAMIERQSKHLTRLVDDLLDLSRVTAGKIVLQRRAVDLNELIRQSIGTVLETSRTHDVSIELDPHEDALYVDGDPLRLDQIVLNLLTNSIKYTPAGGHVVISAERDGDSAVFRVKDTGVGIAPQRIGSIFGLFAQAENAIGRSQGGMGIGLSLVRNLVDLHGGTVSAKSDGVGKGSEFTVTLPLSRALPDERSSPTGKPAQPPAGRRIVIIEDNPDVRSLLQLKLRRLGHEVEAVGDGERGVQCIEQIRPDMALVDLGLPGMNGYEVAQHVRETVGSEIFLVALSGFGQPEDKRRAAEAGFDEHMTKPADVKDLEALLTRIPNRRIDGSGSATGSSDGELDVRRSTREPRP